MKGDKVWKLTRDDRGTEVVAIVIAPHATEALKQANYHDGGFEHAHELDVEREENLCVIHWPKLSEDWEEMEGKADEAQAALERVKEAIEGW